MPPLICQIEYYKQALASSSLVYQLTATSFVTGLLNATINAEFGIFTSVLTGNLLLLGIGAFNIRSISLVSICASIISFCLISLIFGQLALKIGPGKGRTRWWVLFSSIFQTLLLFIVVIILFTIKSIQEQFEWILIALLATSNGAQVTMARQLLVPEIPTAMLTSPIVDLLTDPYLFSLTINQSHNTPRNRRLGHIVALIGGLFCGSVIYKHSSMELVVLIGACLKGFITITFLNVKGEKLTVTNPL